MSVVLSARGVVKSYGRTAGATLAVVMVVVGVGVLFLRSSTDVQELRTT